MNFKEAGKYISKMTEYRTKYNNCGHSVLIPPHLDKVICDWCGIYVFKNKKAEFTYRLKEKLVKKK